ncbi:MAG TPA: formyltransferase family protein [Ferruginibacter sp.]|nr:formyltransferase family protein [Ferruginibacter sp.]HMP19644.1 formyltransferase family protein [Ferruginibacter sp.]
MKILYVTRHFNHSGYVILQRLIDEKIPIAAILLHKDDDKWRKPLLRHYLKWKYYFKCRYYNCQPLRTLNSEESLAKKNGIPIIWTDSIKSDSFYADLQKLNPDIIVLGGGWHELIPKRVFSFPPLGCINTHPSLLPEFRGTSITRWQVLHGVEKSGSTIHYVDDTFDTGGVLAQKEIAVSKNVTPQQLFYILGKAGADTMIPLLQQFKTTGRQVPYMVEHNPEYYNYYKRWSWDIEKLKIDWHQPFRSIHFKVLANTQESFEYLGTHFRYNGRQYFLRKTTLVNLNSTQQDFVNGLKDDSIYVYGIEKGSIILCRKNDAHGLVLETLQRHDKYYKYRRSYPANTLLKAAINTKFKYDE